MEQRLAESIVSVRRLALVGLAKNTGKTEALAALLRELATKDRCVGVTSVGRDGEERDVIDRRIEKPRVRLVAGSLVATTDALLRDSGIPHEPLEQTGIRTPLGRVVIARVLAEGAIEVAGPSAAEDVRSVGEAMSGYGAEHVLIDGALDRRAASSPTVADGLVISTGAILSGEIDEVVERTREAVDLVRLPVVDDARVREAASQESALVGEGYEQVELPPRFALTGTQEDVGDVLRRHPRARAFVVGGAVCEPFLEGLLRVRRSAGDGAEIAVVAADSTRVFLSRRGPEWYRRQGVAIETLEPIALKAITVNPVAPQSHRFDSRELRERVEEVAGDVPVFDVLDPAYMGS
jgi:hypothetical protein